MKDSTLQIVERFWAHDLGLDTDGFDRTEILCSVQTLYNGVQMFRRAGQLVVAVPASQQERVQSSMVGCSVDEVFSASWLKSALGKHATKILGPAEAHYADETTFRSPDSSVARELQEEDSVACRQLQGSLSATEAEDSGFRFDVFPSFGVFSGSMLCAAANYSLWKPSIAHIIVATHPEYRRRGFAKAAIGALAQHALKRELILQWSAVAWNVNSLALARVLGFEYYCTRIFARLRS